MGPISTDSPEFEYGRKGVKEQIEKFMNNNGTHSVDVKRRTKTTDDYKTESSHGGEP
jgi:hypothetical protein